MKTNCYCILCPKHPKYSQRNDLEKPLLSYTVDRWVGTDHEHQKGEVDCLDPQSDARLIVVGIKNRTLV